jgi:Ca2+-binding EF-hand superfamily protein
MNSVVINILKNEKKFLQVTKTAFEIVDVDKSGSIDIDELGTVMRIISNDFGSDPPTKEEIAEVMECLDVDKSGTVEFDEFKLFIKDVLCVLLICDY